VGYGTRNASLFFYIIVKMLRIHGGLYVGLRFFVCQVVNCVCK